MFLDAKTQSRKLNVASGKRRIFKTAAAVFALLLIFLAVVQFSIPAVCLIVDCAPRYFEDSGYNGARVFLYTFLAGAVILIVLPGFSYSVSIIFPLWAILVVTFFKSGALYVDAIRVIGLTLTLLAVSKWLWHSRSEAE